MDEYKTTKTKREKPEAAPVKRKKKRSGGKIALTVFGVIAGVVIVAVLAGFLYVWSQLKKLQPDTPENLPEQYSEVESEVDLTNADGEVAKNFDLLEEIRGYSDLSSILEGWATNNTDNSIMYSDDVLNILLLGVDKGGGNADTIMLCSINQKTKQIYLTSIMRDSFTYVKTPRTSYFGKINSAYGNGGVDCMVQTVENDFKVRVDYYVSVNFNSFSAIVDAIGGVEVPVQEYEMHYIKSLNTYGESVKLNGEQALEYCRIRYSDSDGDVSRTRRQRQFINALIKRSRSLTMTQAKDVVTTLLKYVKTNCPTGTILSLMTKALTNKWAEYPVTPLTLPTPDFRMDYRGYAWVWIVDYPPLAQYLQDTIYGSSNIKLSPNHVNESAIAVMRNRQTGTARP